MYKLLGLGLAALLLVAGFIGVFRYYGRQPSAVNIDLSSVQPGTRKDQDKELCLVVHPSVVPVTTLEDYQALADYLALQVGRPFRIVHRRTYAEVIELLRSGTVTVAIVCTGAWLEMRQNKMPLEGAAMPVIAGASSYRSVILVPSASPIKDIEGLAGRSFGFTDPLSLSGYLYPHWLLIDRGLDPGVFLGPTSFSYSHEASLRAVAAGTVDAASVDSLVLDRMSVLDPSVRSSVRVIHESPVLPFAPVVMPESVDSALRNRIRDALVGMHESQAGRAVLARIHIDHFVEPQVNTYDLVLRIHEQVNRFLRR